MTAGSPPLTAAAPRRAASSLADDLDEHLAPAGPVELAEEDLLPLAERQLPVDHGDRLRGGAHQRRTAVRVPVGDLVGIALEPLRADGEVVVAVVHPVPRGDVLEHLLEVLDEPALALVDHDGARGVRRVHDRHSVTHLAALDDFDHIVRQVDELAAAFGLKIVVLESYPHTSSPRSRARPCKTYHL